MQALAPSLANMTQLQTLTLEGKWSALVHHVPPSVQ